MSTNWQAETQTRPELQGKILTLYKDQIVYVGNSYDEAVDFAKAQPGFDSIHYSYYAVPVRKHEFRILTLKIRSLKQQNWEPLFPVDFHLDSGERETQKMLIDSGADISVLSLAFGHRIGFTKGKHEATLEAQGVGGTVKYLLRECSITVNGHQFNNRFAWLQDPDQTEMIIGREDVFDQFDIEFKQADETILFKKRASTSVS